jgi:hypothetical protein
MNGERLRCLLVAVTAKATWTRRFDMNIAPFVGLGIRLDVYDMVNVTSVIVGDPKLDVTCIVAPEGGGTFDPIWLERRGFEPAPYP